MAPVLSKTLVQITQAAREAIERLYQAKPLNTEQEVMKARAVAGGILTLWSDLAFDMGATPGISFAEQSALESLVQHLDNGARACIGMPPLE